MQGLAKAMRNLITDVAGVRVGHADDATPRLRRDRDRVRRARGRRRRRARRRAGHARDRPARRRTDGRARSTPSCCPAARPSGSTPPSGVQAWLREQGRGFAIGDTRMPIVAGAIAVRPAQRRRQGLGPLSALSRSWLRGCGRRRARFHARQRRRRLRRDHGQPQGRARLGLGRNARGPHASARSSRSMPAAASPSATSKHFWAAPFEQDREFGGHGSPPACRPRRSSRIKGRAGENTTSRWSRPMPASTKAQANNSR